MPSLNSTSKSPPPNAATMSNSVPSPPPPPPATMATSSSSSSNNLHKLNATPHQVGARQATRSRTRTRQAHPVNVDVAGPSQARRVSLPRHHSEDHPLSSHKLAAKGYHSFQCLGVPFHVKRRYTFLRELGIGAYGCVALARDHLLECNVAIKKVTRVFERDVLARRALREVAVLRHIGQSDNVTALLDFDTTFIEFNEIYLVLEASEADLSQIIRSGQALSDAHLQYFIAQILRGVRYMHAANIIHRDLKPGNLLVNADCQLKVCDFGLARAYAARQEVTGNESTIEEEKTSYPSPIMERTFPESPKDAEPMSPKGNLAGESSVRLHTTLLDFPGGPLTEYVATRWYRAPEIMLCFRRGYGQQIDMWSVGCIVAELLGGKPIFAGKDYVDQIARINNVLGSPSAKTVDKVGSERAKTYLESLPKMPAVPFSRLYPSASPLAVDLLDKLLCWDPDDRISAEEALRHPWLKAYHRSNSNWTPPFRFNRFEEVELLETIGDFRAGLEREADEMQAELEALEDEEAAALQDQQDRTGSSDGSDNAASSEEKQGSDVAKDSGSNSSHSARGSTMRSLQPLSSPGASPVPTPSSLATSANETSPTYETDLTSASAPHSITSGNSAKKTKIRAMDGLGLLSQDQLDQTRTEKSRSHNASQERRALDETLANHGLLGGDNRSQVDFVSQSRSRFRRRALTNAPSRLTKMKRHGSEGTFRSPPIIRTKDDLAAPENERLIDITRRSELQREEHNLIADHANSITAWLNAASLNWLPGFKSGNTSAQDMAQHGNTTISRDGSDTTVGFGVGDTARHSPVVQS